MVDDAIQRAIDRATEKLREKIAIDLWRASKDDVANHRVLRNPKNSPSDANSIAASIRANALVEGWEIWRVTLGEKRIEPFTVKELVELAQHGDPVQRKAAMDMLEQYHPNQSVHRAFRPSPRKPKL